MESPVSGWAIPSNERHTRADRNSTRDSYDGSVDRCAGAGDDDLCVPLPWSLPSRRTVSAQNSLQGCHGSVSNTLETPWWQAMDRSRKEM